MPNDGCTLGVVDGDGDLEGGSLGKVLGLDEGALDGAKVVGAVLGVADGDPLATKVGPCDGTLVGSCDGIAVGLKLGAVDGLKDGILEGLKVGAIVGGGEGPTTGGLVGEDDLGELGVKDGCLDGGVLGTSVGTGDGDTFKSDVEGVLDGLELGDPDGMSIGDKDGMLREVT